MKHIQKLYDVLYFVKEEVRRLLSLIESLEEESSSFSVNITAHDSHIYNASVSGTLNFNQQQQSAERAQQQKDVEKSGEEEHDEEDKIPSDLSIDHHPNRTCEYSLKIIGSEEDKEEINSTRPAKTSNESKGMLNNICMSDLRMPSF
ncbi:hypothetical protein BDC45DRAFT_307554 [Circinella umbellata]|nr:hypothetical protein BDC45DRAFT_307554 [Circinella umbellata]